MPICVLLGGYERFSLACLSDILKTMLSMVPTYDEMLISTVQLLLLSKTNSENLAKGTPSIGFDQRKNCTLNTKGKNIIAFLNRSLPLSYIEPPDINYNDLPY
jgi:hypothetical protein